MAFDFNLSVRFVSGGTERGQRPCLSSQGVSSMNEWLYEELAGLQQSKQDQTTKDERLRLLQQQTAVIWNDLRPVLQDAVQKMNEMSEFRKLTGGIVYAPGVDRVEIRKQTT